ncbi:MAG: CRTAC1 family protein [Acidobacteriia bacterium]|nr:CRTAC1 family protein [Terriglobia bacterium]
MRSPHRRGFLHSVSRTAAVFTFDQLLGQVPGSTSTIPPTPDGIRFINIAREAGLRSKTIYGSEKRNKYLLETTGCGAAFFDYDNDGWLDIFLSNGTRFEDKVVSPASPVSRLYKNNRDGTFTDVTREAGIARTGWGGGCCVGDFDNDGLDDLFVTYWGDCSLWKNLGNGKFIDVAAKAGVTTRTKSGLRRHNTGCSFLDYNKDGHLDLFVANYIDFDPKTAPLPESGPCKYKGLLVACGPPGLQGGKNILFRNNGDGTFTDVSAEAGILKTPGTYGLGVVVCDFDNDTWPDIYVANDSTSSTLYKNNHDGTFTDVAIESGAAYSADGKPQAGMGVGVADYDCDGRFDIVKTNFAGDTSTLYHNSGDGFFEDRTFQSGLGRITRFLGWGATFMDFDNDGFADILLCNGHVYPEVGDSDLESGYRQRKLAWRNLGNGRFQEIGDTLGPGITEKVTGRGMAIGDFDNDGDLDILVNCINDVPQLLRCDSTLKNTWLKVRTIGTKSNRTGIGTRIYCTSLRAGKPHKQMDEVRSGGSYLSQSDLRVHFGLLDATTADLEIHWPSGIVDKLPAVKTNQILAVTEGQTHLP